MIIKVECSEINGIIRAPASKSVAQRAVAIASMANGISEIEFTGNSDDVLAAIEVCKGLGSEISGDAIKLTVKGNLTTPFMPLDCGESGLSIRMFSAIASSLSKKVTLTGRGSLITRPMDMVEQSLLASGVKCESNKGYLPVVVHGPLPGGFADIDGSISSQVLTGLLIAAPYAIKSITYKVKDLKSRPYIDITTRMMKFFGVEVENRNYEEFFITAPQKYIPRNYTVEGDWSGAAFLLVAGALAGHITVENLNFDSYQADKAVIKALVDCGAIISQEKDKVFLKRDSLKAFNFDATHCPDLFPPLVALAAASEGVSEITGVSRLRVKESDRAAALKQEYEKLGISIIVEDDKMKIMGGTPVGAEVHSHHDHRIAMACAVTGLQTEKPVIIKDAQVVAKSYPEFFVDLKKVGAFII